MAGTIAQDRAWALSCVLRAPTDRGTVYFKATADLPLFVNEARLTRCLGDILPGATPAVIASDDARGWMLTADFGQALGGDAPPEEMVAALGAWARAQRTTSTQTHALLAAGCYDRRLDGLAQRIDDLARDPATLEHLPSGASDSLLRATTQVASVCARLAEIGIPDCLVHGDLHMGNIAGGEGRYVFFDWTDACVSHPFMDGLLPYRLGDATVKGRARDAIRVGRFRAGVQAAGGVGSGAPGVPRPPRGFVRIPGRNCATGHPGRPG